MSLAVSIIFGACVFGIIYMIMGRKGQSESAPPVAAQPVEPIMSENIARNNAAENSAASREFEIAKTGNKAAKPDKSPEEKNEKEPAASERENQPAMIISGKTTAAQSQDEKAEPAVEIAPEISQKDNKPEVSTAPEDEPKSEKSDEEKPAEIAEAPAKTNEEHKTKLPRRDASFIFNMSSRIENASIPKEEPINVEMESTEKNSQTKTEIADQLPSEVRQQQKVAPPSQNPQNAAQSGETGASAAAALAMASFARLAALRKKKSDPAPENVLTPEVSDETAPTSIQDEEISAETPDRENRISDEIISQEPSIEVHSENVQDEAHDELVLEIQSAVSEPAETVSDSKPREINTETLVENNVSDPEKFEIKSENFGSDPEDLRIITAHPVDVMTDLPQTETETAKNPAGEPEVLPEIVVSNEITLSDDEIPDSEWGSEIVSEKSADNIEEDFVRRDNVVSIAGRRRARAAMHTESHDVAEPEDFSQSAKIRSFPDFDVHQADGEIIERLKSGDFDPEKARDYSQELLENVVSENFDDYSEILLAAESAILKKPDAGLCRICAAIHQRFGRVEDAKALLDLADVLTEYERAKDIERAAMSGHEEIKRVAV